MFEDVGDDHEGAGDDAEGPSVGDDEGSASDVAFF